MHLPLCWVLVAVVFVHAQGLSGSLQINNPWVLLSRTAQSLRVLTSCVALSSGWPLSRYCSLNAKPPLLIWLLRHYQCEPVVISWTGNMPPYLLSVLPGGDANAGVLENLPATSSNSITWTPDLRSGTPHFGNINVSPSDTT